MTPPDVRHIFHLTCGGGERHRYCILIAAEVAAAKGYKLEDMTRYTQNPYQPDLIIWKQDRFVSGPRRNNGRSTFWVEIIDTSDPPREWVRLPNELLRIDISKCATLEECVNAIKRGIP